ncbi:MAG: phytanoyl-CoA dioxygenase family protein [Acidimicrobiales bacterium]
MSGLDATRLADYERDGFVVLPDFVSAERCETLRHRALEIIDAFDPTTVPAAVFSTTDQTHAQEQYFLTSGGEIRCFLEDGVFADGRLSVPKDRAVNKIGHAMHDRDPVFEAFSYTPDLADVLASLGFTEPTALQSMYICKAAGTGGEVIAHCDHTFLWTEPQSVVGLWFAIDDATVDNGCLWALPGGHRLGARTRFRRVGNGTTTEVLDPEPYPTEGFVPLEAPRGTLVVLDGTLPHRSEPNRSERSRHAYTLHVIDATAEYPADNWLRRDDTLPLRPYFTVAA